MTNKRLMSSVVPSPGEMGPMVASTLKLGIAILNGGNSTVQQVFQCSATSVSVMYLCNGV